MESLEVPVVSFTICAFDDEEKLVIVFDEFRELMTGVTAGADGVHHVMDFFVFDADERGIETFRTMGVEGNISGREAGRGDWRSGRMRLEVGEEVDGTGAVVYEDHYDASTSMASNSCPICSLWNMSTNSRSLGVSPGPL